MSAEIYKPERAKNPDFTPEKVNRAANHPEHPGEKCLAESGVYKPIVNRNQCEGIECLK